MELSSTKVLLFGGASIANQIIHNKRTYTYDTEKNTIIENTNFRILKPDKFYSQHSRKGTNMFFLGKEHIHVFDMAERKFKIIKNRGL